MQTLEDIMHEAYKLGIHKKVYKKVKKLKQKEKYRYQDLNTIYTKAFNKVFKKHCNEQING